MKNEKIMITAITMFVMYMVTVSLSGCVFRLGDEIYQYDYKEIEVDENTILTVNNVNGLVSIKGTKNDSVSLTVIKQTNERWGEEEFDKVIVELTEQDNNLAIYTDYIENNTHVSVLLYLDVPMFIAVDVISTVNGAINVNNIEGDNPFFRTTNGAIVLKDITIKGNTLNAETINGLVDIFNVDFTEAPGDVYAQTTSGLITVDNVQGFVGASTTNGAISIQDCLGVYDITTINGAINVEITDVVEDILISCLTGSINAYLSADIDAEITIDVNVPAGGFQIDEIIDYLDIIHLETDYLVASLNHGGPRIDMEITTGLINLYKLD